MNEEESKLYDLLSSEPTRVFTKEEIIKSLFPDYQQEHTPIGIGMGPTRLIDKTAVSLRERLLEENPDARRIINVWGIGYRFQETFQG